MSQHFRLHLACSWLLSDQRLLSSTGVIFSQAEVPYQVLCVFIFPALKLVIAARRQTRGQFSEKRKSVICSSTGNFREEVEGGPVVKSKVLHLFRDSGVILLASGGAGLELLQIWGHWAKGSLGQAYTEKNPLAALQAFAIASGWEQSSFMRRHFLGRALVWSQFLLKLRGMDCHMSCTDYLLLQTS
ncbi:hypothetical protein WJX79_002793 [Trebouxia sp. C0005]